MNTQNSQKEQNLELFPFPHSNGSVWKITNKNATNKEPIKTVILSKGSIKYLPQKYSKITMVLNSEEHAKFEFYQNLFKEENNVESFLKTDTISLKLSDEMKERTKSLKVGDNLKVAVEFNGVWKVSGKLYASWNLVDFKQLEKEKVSYFS